MKVYLVSETIVIHDDDTETYYPEFNSDQIGCFVKCFKKREDADKYCKEETAKWFQNNSVFEYSKDSDGCIEEMGDCVKEFLEAFGYSASYMQDDLSEIYTELFIPLATFQPYGIAELDIE